jgi:hypothetical protein
MLRMKMTLVLSESLSHILFWKKAPSQSEDLDLVEMPRLRFTLVQYRDLPILSSCQMTSCGIETPASPGCGRLSDHLTTSPLCFGGNSQVPLHPRSCPYCPALTSLPPGWCPSRLVIADGAPSPSVLGGPRGPGHLHCRVCPYCMQNQVIIITTTIIIIIITTIIIIIIFFFIIKSFVSQGSDPPRCLAVARYLSTRPEVLRQVAGMPHSLVLTNSNDEPQVHERDSLRE